MVTSASTIPAKTSNTRIVPLISVPLCDWSRSPTRSSAWSRKSRTSWRETSNGLSSTSQFSTSSIASSMVGPRSSNSLAIDGTSNATMPTSTRMNPTSTLAATRARGRPLARR